MDWFGNGNSSTGTDDPTDASTGLDLSSLSNYHSDWKRFSFFHDTKQLVIIQLLTLVKILVLQKNMTPDVIQMQMVGVIIFFLSSGYLGLCVPTYQLMKT